MMEAIDDVVVQVMRTEASRGEAAAYRIGREIGLAGLIGRCVRQVYDSDGGVRAGLLAGRRVEIAVDGAVVWRGQWEGDGLRAGWHEEWLTDPSTLSATPAPAEGE